MTRRMWVKRDGMWSSYDPVIRKKRLSAKRREIIEGIKARWPAVKARVLARKKAARESR